MRNRGSSAAGQVPSRGGSLLQFLQSIPRPVGDAEAVRHIIRRLIVAGHGCRGRPREVRVERLLQRMVIGEPGINNRLVEAGNCTAVHLVVLSVAAVHLDDGRLVAASVRLYAGAAQRLSPVSGKSLDMLRKEAVAERMTDHLVGCCPPMPRRGKATQALIAPGCLENGTHRMIITTIPGDCKTIAGSEPRCSQARIRRNPPETRHCSQGTV